MNLTELGTSYCADHRREPFGGGLNAHQGHGTTRAQQKLVAQVIHEEPLCVCGSPSTQAGHIIPRSKGGTYTRANLRGMCVPCNLAQIHADADRDPYSDT